MRDLRRPLGVITAGAALLAAALGIPASAAAGGHHVLLISVDGMHQSDLAWYVKAHPQSTLARLVNTGEQFTAASTPFPSDSFPGMVGQVTGGNPRTTGIYYDVTFNQALIDPSASTSATPPSSVCGTTAVLGANIAFDESIDSQTSALDAGQGLTLPQDILQMTGNPRTLINAAALPIDPTTCKRIYPHQYLKVNTVFEVAKAAGLHTAWSDKHPAYEILSGPSGKGIDDLFTPEINSDAGTSGGDWTSVNSLTQQYDDYKVQAVVNEINGFDHSGRTKAGMPGIFGMNFQSVSTAEKLAVSNGMPGGYDASGTVPGPVLQSALSFVDRELATMQLAIEKSGHVKDTTIIVSAKHGQSPQDSASLKRIDDGPIVDALNAAWLSTHPTAAQPLVVNAMDDDGVLMWFSQADRNAVADAFAVDFLKHYNGNGTGTDGQAKATNYAKVPVAYTSAGVAGFYTGADAVKFMGLSAADERVPDLIGVVQHGVVYTGKTKKIAEHGGNDPQDRHVPLIVSGAGVRHGVKTGAVETTQIAPTILELLHLNPSALKAVQLEHTALLPLS